MLTAAGPLLVGVVDTAAALERLADATAARAGDAGSGAGLRNVDLVEARVDLFAPEDRAVGRWSASAARLEAGGTPVLVTIRLATEGGRWTAPEDERLALYREALAVASWVDVEAASSIAAAVAAAARAARRIAVLSHHDFARTPPLAALLAIVDGARALGAAVAKVATLVTGPADRDALLELLAQRPDGTCVIGMGEEAQDLRVTLAARGSRLAYGYLDRPTAPGQISAAEMDQRLRAAAPAYAARRRF